MSEYRQSYSTTIAAPVTDCFAVLVAFEDYPRWSSPITSCRVLEHHADGLPKRVEFTLDMTVKTIRYVLDYDWSDAPSAFTWKLVEGDMLRALDGRYAFEPEGDATRVVYDLRVDLSIPLPGLVKRRAAGIIVGTALKELKRAAENP